MGQEAREGILGRQLIMGGRLDHGGAGSKGAWQNRSESCNYRVGGKDGATCNPGKGPQRDAHTQETDSQGKRKRVGLKQCLGPMRNG